LTQTIQFGYDKNGNTTKTLFPKGDTVSNTYNALNRMDGMYYNGVKQWGLAYDASGNLTTITDGAGNTTSSMSYDKNNRLTQQAEGASNSIAYGYDDNSNLTSLTATAGATTVATGYTFNPLNLMVALSRNGTNQAKFVYDYLMARYYDAGVGRFITRDTFQGHKGTVLLCQCLSLSDNVEWKAGYPAYLPQA